MCDGDLLKAGCDEELLRADCDDGELMRDGCVEEFGEIKSYCKLSVMGGLLRAGCDGELGVIV